MDTRARILSNAERLFAEHGLAGASVSQLAEDAGLAKASLLHHFPTKRALYGAVLEAVAADLLAATEGEATLGDALRALSEWMGRRPTAARLILRELVDNPARASTARKWPLAPLLNGMAERAAGRGVDPEALVMFALGGIALVDVGAPTVAAIDGEDRREVRDRLRGALPALLSSLVEDP